MYFQKESWLEIACARGQRKPGINKYRVTGRWLPIEPCGKGQFQFLDKKRVAAIFMVANPWMLAERTGDWSISMQTKCSYGFAVDSHCKAILQEWLIPMGKRAATVARIQVSV
ncbi:hypothetical protein [Polaromonas sp. CG_23.6]|uniref:hypothetical protein n=1 Tax=Polaromonas sp. CG_23.6 TaxID=2760709 RepID=UPI00247415A6|nr:hypothetical protein [Polaromonas sp. CG_23.6]MDH6185844.1 hypothetical protein [Polaromonas sp. CG_23.6]